MFSIFAKEPTAKEALEENVKKLRRNVRELERERTKMERRADGMVIEIKKLAKKGQMSDVRIIAKDLVNTRNAISAFNRAKAKMNTISNSMQLMSSTAQMSEAMRDATKSMMAMNRQISGKSMQRIAMQMDKEMDQMEMKQEIIDDAMNQDGENQEEDEKAIIDQVLEEIGIVQGDSLSSVPVVKKELIHPPAAIKEGDDLTSRLDNLRKK